VKTKCSWDFQVKFFLCQFGTILALKKISCWVEKKCNKYKYELFIFSYGRNWTSHLNIDQMKNPKCILFFWSVEKSKSCRLKTKNVVGSDILDCSAVLYIFFKQFYVSRLKFFGAVLTCLEHVMLWWPSWISPPFCIRKKGHKILRFFLRSKLSNKTIKSAIAAFASERCFR
jgi:hypothetical protein